MAYSRIRFEIQNSATMTLVHGVVREGAFGRKELKRLAEMIGVFKLRADDVADNGSEHCCLPYKINFRSRPD